jgi:hypothetical protein
MNRYESRVRVGVNTNVSVSHKSPMAQHERVIVLFFIVTIAGKKLLPAGYSKSSSSSGRLARHALLVAPRRNCNASEALTVTRTRRRTRPLTWPSVGPADQAAVLSCLRAPNL